MSVSKSTLTGAAGEHFVMFRLLQMGYIAGLAPQGAPNADIIVTNVAGTKTAVLQIKTRNPKGKDGGWHMKEKHEKISSPTVFYCFVDLGDDIKKTPVTHIIPSTHVATTLVETHLLWSATPGKKGQAHRPTKMRRLIPDYSKTIKTTDKRINKYSMGWLDKYREN